MATSRSITTIIKGEDEFQDFCLDLFREVWRNPHAQLYGRRGTGQRGIDIVGDDKRGDPPIRSGVQCKGTETNKPREPELSELRSDVDKAKAHDPPLKHFTFAYAGPRIPALQDEAAKLTELHRQAGLFEVSVYSWDDLLDLLRDFPRVRANHIPLDLPTVELGLEAVAVRIEQDERPPVDDIESIRRIAVHAIKISGAGAASAEDADGPDKWIHEQLDTAKALLLEGKPGAALEALKILQARLPETAGARARFRVRAQLGHAYLALENVTEAIVKFTDAAAYAPKAADKHAYLAYAACQKDEREAAFKEAGEALAIDATHQLAQTVWAEAAPSSLTPEKIEQKVGATAAKDPDIGRILVKRWAAAGNLERALHWADVISANENEKYRWFGDMAAGEALVEAALDDELAKIGGEIDKDQQANIEAAVERFERAWATIKARPDAARWAYVGTNLASAYSLAGRGDDAKRAIDEAFALAPNDRHVRQRKAAADVPRGKAKEAWVLLQAGPDVNAGDAEARHFAAEVALAADDNEAALKLALPLIDELPRERRNHVAWVAINAAMKAKEKDAAFALFSEVTKKMAPDPSVWVAGADAARQAGDFKAAEAIEAELASIDLAALSPVQRFEFALAMSKREHYSLAADALAGLYRPNRASPPLYEALVALLNADRRFEAVALYEALAPEIRDQPRYRRVGAAIYSRAQRLGHAIAELDSLLAQNPDDLRSRLDWVRTLYRNGEAKRANQWLKKSAAPADASPSDLMELAHHWDVAGRPIDAINLAYRVLRDNWGADEELHNAYLGLFFARPMRAKRPKNPTQVEPDAWVQLSDVSGGAIDERTIEAELTPDPARKEIGPSHELAQKLMGKKVGDEIEFGGAIRERRRVDAILHKTIRLLHRAMEQHASLFPGSDTLGRVSLDLDSDNPFEEMKRVTCERAEFTERAEAGYIEGQLPISVFAQIVHVDPYSAWGGLVQRKLAKIRIARGDPESRNHALRNLRMSQAATLDPLTFYQWRDFGILQRAAERFGKFPVAQSFFDLIGQTLEGAKRNNDAKGSLSWEHGRMVMHETTAEQRRATVRYWEDVQTDAKRLCQVVAVESLTTLGGSEQVASLIPGPFVDSIAVALEQNCVFLCEDVVLRDVAALCGVERSAWSQPFMAEGRAQGTMSALDSAKLVQQLVKHNSAFVTVHSEDLTAALSDFGLTKDLFDALSQATPPSVSAVLAQHIWEAWNDSDVSEWARSTLAVRVVTHLRKHHALTLGMIMHDMNAKLEAQEDEWNTTATARSRNARATLLTASRATRDPSELRQRGVNGAA